MSLPKQAVILAAGEGLRLRPLTDVTPKPLLPFYGVSLLDWALDSVLAAGVTRVAVNAFHLSTTLAAHIKGWQQRFPQLEVHVSVEPQLLGTGGALRYLQPWLGEQSFYVVNADTVCLASLTKLTHPLSLLLTQEASLANERRLLLTTDQRLTALTPTAHPEAYTFCGMSRWDKRLFEVLPQQGPACLVRDGLVPLLNRGEAIYGVPHMEFFADLGTPERLVGAHLRAEPFIRALPKPLIQR